MVIDFNQKYLVNWKLMIDRAVWLALGYHNNTHQPTIEPRCHYKHAIHIRGVHAPFQLPSQRGEGRNPFIFFSKFEFLTDNQIGTIDIEYEPYIYQGN